MATAIRAFIRRAAGAALGCVVGAAVAQTSVGDVIHAKVVAYGSASALAVLDPAQKLRRVKLTGIDAPQPKQPFAAQARQLAADYLGTKPVPITVDAIGDDERVHGRIAIDGVDLGLVLLEAGFAWCDPSDTAKLPEALRSAYGHACQQARSERRGLWQDAHPVAPWEYRKIPHFDAPRAGAAAGKHCRDIGYQTLQCDDGSRYRALGNQLYGSDGTIYTRRGNTVTGSDGSRFEIQGALTYGSDGSICRTRGKRVDCHY